MKGTAATERSAERPGDGVSPGACAVDQITPERPEERPSPARVRARTAARRRLSRAGKTKYKGSERMQLTPYPFLPVLPGRPKAGLTREVKGSPGGQRGWYRGAAETRLVPLAELIR